MKILLAGLLSHAAVLCGENVQDSSTQRSPVPSEALTWQGSEVRPEDVLVRLERSECYGSCPSYVVTLQGDGTVRFRGRMHVQATDERTTSVPRVDVQYLLDRFAELDFFQLRDSYRIACTDLPTDTLILGVGSTRKSVENYSMGERANPWGREYDGWKEEKELKLLAEAIDSVLGLEDWIERDKANDPPSQSSLTNPVGIPEQQLPEVRIELDAKGDEFQSPEYRIVVHGNGTVEWTGRKYVREIGERTATVPVENVRRILRRIGRSGFFEMKPVDLSSMDTSYPVSLHVSTPGRDANIDGARILRHPKGVTPTAEMTDRSIELTALARAIRVGVRADRWIGCWDEGHPREKIEDR